MKIVAIFFLTPPPPALGGGRDVGRTEPIKSEARAKRQAPQGPPLPPSSPTHLGSACPSPAGARPASACPAATTRRTPSSPARSAPGASPTPRRKGNRRPHRRRRRWWQRQPPPPPPQTPPPQAVAPATPTSLRDVTPPLPPAPSADPDPANGTGGGGIEGGERGKGSPKGCLRIAAEAKGTLLPHLELPASFPFRTPLFFQ